MQDTQDHPIGFSVAQCADGGGAPARTAANLPASRVLAAFALTTEVEELIDACLAELRLVIPQLRPWRGRISGRRVFGAHSLPEHGEAAARGVRRGVQRGFTRIDLEFEVEIDPASPEVVSLACHSTIRGRDRQTTRTRIPLPTGEQEQAGRQRVTEWIESVLLDFATDWFQVRRREAGICP